MRSTFNRPVFWIGAGIVAILVLAAAWYLGSPLLIDRTVAEAFPFELPPEEAIDEMSPAEKEALQAALEEALPSPEEMTAMPAEVQSAVAEEAMAAAAGMPDKAAEEEMPAAALPRLLAEGTVQGADRLHQGEGTAKIYQLEDGSYLLRLEGFSVTNGPDLHVLVSEHPAPANRDEVMQGYLDLGKLKGNIGDQNYAFPAGVAVEGFQSMIIYCEPFHVIFATASLQAVEG